MVGARIRNTHLFGIGIKIGVKAIVFVNESGSSDSFAQAAVTIKDSSKLALILVTDSPDAMAAAAAKTKESVPLLASATPDNAEEMAKIAKENGCPVVAKADSLDSLAELTEKIKASGVEDIVLKI